MKMDPCPAAWAAMSPPDHRAGGCADQPQNSPQGSTLRPDSPEHSQQFGRQPECRHLAAPPSVTVRLEPAETKPAPSKPAVDEKKMSVTKEAYGKLPDGTQIDQYTLSQPERAEGQDHQLRRDHDRGRDARSQRPRREHHAAPRLAGRLPGNERRQADHALLRRHGRPLRQPHRQGPLHPGGQGVHAGRQQRAQCPARRTEGL